MNLFCIAVMSGISLCRMTERSNGRGGSCLLPLFICHLNMTYAVASSSLFCTAIVLCYFQQLVTRWPPLCCVCLCERSLSEREVLSRQPGPSSSRSGAPLMSPNIPVCSLWAQSDWRILDVSKKKKQPQAQANKCWRDVCLFCILYCFFFLMYEHSDCIWNY